LNRFIPYMVLGGLLAATPLWSQDNAPEPSAPETTLRITSRAVLVDVTVTDHDGNPVTGLKEDAFTVLDQGKPQTISYFEEHNRAEEAKKNQGVVFPAQPANVFTNFSPIAPPAAVNLLLLDTLNTPMDSQMVVREQARSYLKNLKPGSRIGIFIMSLRLSFVQGFADDPAVLAAALGYKKNARPEPAVLLQSQEEANAQSNVVGMISAPVGGGPGGTTTSGSASMISGMSDFLSETHYAQTSDREYRTLQNLQQLATFLGGFSGRKNLIWMSGDFPLALFGQTETRFEADVRKTVNLLNAARVSIYPIDAHGVVGNNLYTAQSQMDPSISSPSQLLGPPAGMTAGSPNAGQGGFSTSVMNETRDLNSSHSTMEMLARETGGQAFHNSNRLSDAINRVISSSANFYTVSYAPTDEKMDGTLRTIDVKVAGGKYTLSFRRGYYALDQDLPGAAQVAQRRALVSRSTEDPMLVDPLKAFMDFGMPQTEQILYKTSIHPIPEKPDAPATERALGKGPQDRYAVDFAVDLKDISLERDADGNHDGTLNVTLIVYDKYGSVSNRKDHILQMKLKPDIYKLFQQTGVQIHAEIEVPKGQFWLRTGVYDQASHKVGTMEVPFSSVKPVETAAK
jgi:VWFA-related protein